MDSNDKILEQLRDDYAVLKEKLSDQEIINDRLLNATFKAKVKDIHSVGWISSACAVFVIVSAPFAFHYNPVMEMSWAFIIGTEILMLTALFFNWFFHSRVNAPTPGDDLLAFATSVKLLRKRYRYWMRIGFCLLAVWFIWIAVELSFRFETRELLLTLIPIVIGGLIGALAGLRLDRKVISRCDEIIKEIER